MPSWPPPPAAAPRAPEGNSPCSNFARTSSPTSATTISRKSARARSARTCSGTSPATSTYFNDHKLQGMLHLKVAAQPAQPCAHPPHRRRPRPKRSPGVRRVIRGADVPRNLNTLLSLINFGKDDEPTLAVDKVRYKGEPIVAVVADSPREAYEALAKVRVDYEPLPTRVRRRGGAEARRAGRQRDLSEEHLHLSRHLRPPEASLRRCRARLCRVPIT